MASSKKTILKHVDPSKETWKRSLKDRFSLRDFKLEFDLGEAGALQAGFLKSKGDTLKQTRKSTLSAKGRRAKYFGAEWKIKF